MYSQQAKTSNNKNSYSPAASSGAALDVQCKLTIGTVNDPLEAEADAMADKIMRMPDTPLIQRKCASCKEEEKQLQLQRKPLAASITPFIQAKGTESGTASDSVTQQINASKGSGSNLDNHTQSFMESRFGADFSAVKTHTSNDAVQMNRELGAQAFTVGSDVYFNSGKYNPESESGKHLLAHELTHVIQQSSNIQQKKIQRNIGNEHDLSTEKFKEDNKFEDVFDKEFIVKTGGKRGAVQNNPPSCSQLCGKNGTTSGTPQTLIIGQSVFTLCPCNVNKDKFNEVKGYVTFLTKGTGTERTIDDSKLKFTNGFQPENAHIANSKPAWEYSGAVASDEFHPDGSPERDSEVKTGFIQTIESYEWNAKYTNGWETNVTEANVRDAQPSASAPWYGQNNDPSQPQDTSKVVILRDEPYIILSVTHPDPAAQCTKLQSVSTKGKFHLWMIAAESANATSNFVFLFHASINYDRSFTLKSSTADPSNSLSWKGDGKQSEIDKGPGKGTKDPILTTPLATLTFTPKSGNPCPLDKKKHDNS
jgi:hypothetical protein